MRPLLIVDYVQHGKTRSGFKPGASVDLDGDGVIQTNEQEAYLCAIRSEKMVAIGKEMGAPLTVVRVGWNDEIDPLNYDQGHAAINDYVAGWHSQNPGGLSCVVCEHNNAGGGSYGLVAFDHRSRLGRTAAAWVARSWEGHPFLAPRLSRAKVTTASPDGQPYQRRLHYTLRGAYVGHARHCGITLEPGFMDTEEHADLWTDEGLEATARATIAGLMAWAGS